MPQSYRNALLGSLCLLTTVLAYPQNSWSNVARADKFIIGTMGDSWGSGVTYPHIPSNNYDDNKSGCMRYKYAWSTVVSADYAKWAPPNAPKESDLEFRACSGGRLANMKDQMDQMSRPKLVFMEVGGNNADFYPLADACLFHAENKDYGKPYEDDKGPIDKREGLCKREIDLVRGRLTGEGMANFKAEIVKTIHTWRGHKSVTGNDATLMTVGYGRFFAEGKECDKMNFELITANTTQNVVLKMRKEINELIGYMNDAIRTATESFNDKKIQYVNIDPAFQGHRFCEPGSTSWDQFNNNNNVWIWNQPTRIIITITKDGDVKQYETGEGVIIETPPPKDIFNSLIGHRDGPVTKDGEYSVINFKDPNMPNTKMTFKIKAKDAVSVLNGSKSRTLHPTEPGHKAMGDIVVQRLKQVLQESTDPVILQKPCPTDCTCNGIVPLCQ